jgi:formate--tetrahydrofolate ligase
METIAKKMYGAAQIFYTKDADKDLALIERLGYQGLPLCVAKTPVSLSDDPKLAGRPEGFGITVRNFIIAAGAGYVVPLLGEILRMPGLPKEPQSKHIDLVDGEVVGLR